MRPNNPFIIHVAKDRFIKDVMMATDYVKSKVKIKKSVFPRTSEFIYKLFRECTCHEQ